MKDISIQVGLPGEVTWRGKSVTPNIFKSPVDGHVMLCTPNLNDDDQAEGEAVSLQQWKYKNDTQRLYLELFLMCCGSQYAVPTQ